MTILERFPGYTLGTLLDEDARFLQMVRWVDEEREMMKGVGDAE